MNYFIFIPVATLVLAIFFGAHYGIYAFFVNFFQVFTSHKLISALIFILLAVSFFVSSALAHWMDNAFSRRLYFVSGVWMGTMINILLAMCATMIVLQVTRLFPFPFSESYVAGFFFSVAVLISMYGVWNAMHPRIQNITVVIPNLPEAWKGQKLVQVSDVHLGHIYRAPFLQKVVDMINKENPKLVVITGDLFDGMDGGLPELVSPISNLRASSGTLFIDGNHETYLGTQKTFDALMQTGVRILNNEVTDVDGLSFVGISYPERGEHKNIIDAIHSLQSEFAGKPSVLLYHAPEMIEEVAKTGIDLQLSGHTHQGQQFPFQFITHFVHKGYDYGLYALGNYHLYTSSGVGTWGPSMRIGTQSEIVVITLK